MRAVRGSRTLAALVGAVAVVVATPAARGEGDAPGDEPGRGDATAEARRHAAQAQVHFDLGEYPEAIAAYREAYRLDPRPGLLYNLAQAYRLHGDCVTATMLYRTYLRRAPDTEVRAVVEQHLEALATCVRDAEQAGVRPAIDVDGPPPAADHVDREAGNRPRAPGPVVTPPASMTPAPESSPRPRPGRSRRVAGAVTAAAGGALTAAGVWFAIDARRAAREVSDAYASGGTWAELEAIDARGRRSEVIGVSLLITGAAAVATGATLYVLGVRADQRSVAVIPGAGGAEVRVSWSF